jgi:hypothetical protein
MDYQDFITSKKHIGAAHGIGATYMPSMMFDFQRDLVDWALHLGRAAIFADCGMGKTLMQLTWAENIVRHTNRPVLVLTPLAVGQQTVREAAKFGIDATFNKAGDLKTGIVVTNYESLHHFDRHKCSGVVLDESSILKSFDGSRKTEITEFMKHIPYRLLCTATAAPNDYTELGTSSEALGYLGFMDMLNRFFKNENNNSGLKRMYGEAPKWRFKGHAERPFWRWVTSWARAVRMPSDLGYDDGNFVLPELREHDHLIEAQSAPDGALFNLAAVHLDEQREERKRTVNERCEFLANRVNNTGAPALLWCDLNDEARKLRELVPDAVEVSGNDSDDAKVEKFTAFIDAQIRVLVTKPKIGALGLNFQHCSHIGFFPSHSYEQYYQAIRRCWRYGQRNAVDVDLVYTEGQVRVMKNLQRKAKAADAMFGALVSEMNNALGVTKANNHTNQLEIPTWL